MISLFVFQNLTDSEDVRGVWFEMCPGTYVACQPISIKAEKLPDAEEEENPVPITFTGIKAELEVSCVSLSPC
jgi:hypothetical protein